DADGSILVDLYENGVRVDQAILLFSCVAGGSCPWSTHFGSTAWDGSATWSVHVYRHVQGSLVGQRYTVPASCLPALANSLGLPDGYSLTLADALDLCYVADKSNPNQSVFDAVIVPFCNGSSGTPVSSFTYSPAQVYPNTPVSFSDTSSGFPTTRS